MCDDMISVLARQSEELSKQDTTIAEQADEIERLRAALKMARPFIGRAGHYPTILAEIDAALKGSE